MMKNTRRLMTVILAIAMMMATITTGIFSKTVYAETANNTSYPSSYSLVDAGYVTSVKSQGSYGTCWTFATMASAESSALKKGLGNLDLSELHLAYFSFHKSNDSLSLTSGDSTVVKLSSGETMLDSGGDLQMATLVLAGGVGFVNESKLSYDKATSIANGSFVPASSLAYDSDYYLSEANWASMSDRNAVKALILNNGAVATSYYEGKNTGSYYNDSTYGYYCSTSKTANHGITIVGWDDNYSKNNFLQTPSGNGAWLVKNSWGSSSRNNGYFWISYYDASLSNTAVQFNIDSFDGLNNIYQYDGSANVSKLIFSKQTIRVANIYTAQSTEELKKVGFFTTNAGDSYNISVYINVDSNDPTSGKQVASVNGTSSYAGYHTVDLNRAISLGNGEKFSIVIEMTTTAAKIGVMVDSSSNGTYYTFTNEVAQGQSFYQYVGGSWKDLYSAGKTVRIKAYTYAETSSAATTNATASTVATTTSNSTVSTASASTTSSSVASTTETTVSSTVCLGDVNGDNSINSLDYVMIKNYIMNASSLSDTAMKAADYNQDGVINSLDYVAIKNHIMGH